MSKITSLTLICILLYIFIPFFLLPFNTVYRFLILNALWIYFLVNMILQEKMGIGIEKFEKYPGKFSLSTFAKNHILLFVLILINFGIHIYPIVSRTILLGYDEPTLVQSGLGLFTRVSAVYQKFLNIEFLTLTRIFYFILILALIVFRKKTRIFSKNVVNYFKSHRVAKILFFILLMLLSYIYFVIIRNTAFHESLFRYPPMSKLLYFLTYTMFGIEEFAPRFVQLTVGSIGAVYLFRIILLYYNKTTALLGAVIFLFNPLISYYFNYAELGLGMTSIFVIISFYFIRFLKYKYDNDLLITFLLIGVGFLYKRQILVLPIVIVFSLPVFNSRYFKINFKKISKLIWLAIIPILPFLVISKPFSPPLAMGFSRLFDHHILIYISKLYTQVSYAVVILLALSIVFIIFKERNNLIFFFALLFVSYNALYILHRNYHVDRYSMALYPSIAIFLAILFFRIFHKRKYLFNTAIILFGIYLISISTFTQLPEMQPQFVLYKNYLLEHYPTDEALKWIIDNHNDKNILSIEVRNTAFYRDKLNVKKNRFFSMTVEDFNEISKDELGKFISKNNIGCLMASNKREPYKTDNIDLNNFTSKKEFKYNNGNKIILYLR